ncbi:hypothetical protein DMH17_16200 [Raoultella planticola]|nr:hypothetical protein [Raoultella planticola]
MGRLSCTVLAYFSSRNRIFQPFQLARFRDKVLACSNNPHKGILKVLSNGILKAYPTCHEGSKDENYSKAVVHDVR